MPPAFVLSQDQTLKFVSHTKQARPRLSPRTANPQGMSFKEPIPALSNVMDTRDNVGAAYVPVVGAVSSPNRAPSPTCPFIKTDDVKEPTKTRGGQLIDPRFTPGDRLSVLGWRPKRQEAEKTASAVSVSGHIWSDRDSVNAFLHLYFRGLKTRRNPPFRVAQHMGSRAPIASGRANPPPATAGADEDIFNIPALGRRI